MIKLSNIPNNPGCYIFKDKSNKIIYIGKAKNLCKRVKSYFQKTELDPKTQALVQNIKSVDFFVTDNEVEALLLENNLIKKNRPKYNIDLRDSKSYAFIKITDEEYPRLLIARRKRMGKGKFYGPFIHANTRDYIIWTLKKTFQIRTCKRIPKKACLRYHINLCTAPCIGKISKIEYNDKIKMVELILKGGTKELLESLNEKMKNASEKMNFERALELRNQRDAIEWLSEKQKMERQKIYNEDIINYIIEKDKVYLILFNVYKGILENKQDFEFEYSENFLEEFIVQYYSENNVPRELIISKELDSSLIDFLKTKRNGSVKITIPKKGEKKHLMDLVNKNIELSFFGDIEKLEDLKTKIKLHELPNVIECFDISHLSGTSTVASMVQFRNAKPDKSNYRRFKIMTVDGIDDTSAIAEVVRRRYTRLIRDFVEMPKLIIIDGGRGQLNSAINEINKLNLKIPIISIAKKLEDIYVPGLMFPMKLNKKSKALKLIQEIRDEAHRFAISYNRLLRQKNWKE